MLSLMTSTSVLAEDKNCWNRWLDNEYMMVCNEEGRDAIDYELIEGEEAMKQLELEVNKKPAIRIFWGTTMFIAGVLVAKAID